MAAVLISPIRIHLLLKLRCFNFLLILYHSSVRKRRGKLKSLLCFFKISACFLSGDLGMRPLFLFQLLVEQIQVLVTLCFLLYLPHLWHFHLLITICVIESTFDVPVIHRCLPLRSHCLSATQADKATGRGIALKDPLTERSIRWLNKSSYC